MFKRILRIFNGGSKISTSRFDRYKDYLQTQYRCDPKEFLDGRLKIASSIVYIVPILKRLGIADCVLETETRVKGQLKEDNIRILDAGCRDGWTIEFLNSIGYKNVVGVELFDDYVDYCNRHGRQAEKGDLHNLHFADGSFDFIYCRHVLEHCLDPAKVLDELLRVIRSGGAVYCSFPLESSTFGKHTTAVPTVRAARRLLKQLNQPFRILHAGRSARTGIVLPESDEMLLFLQKTNLGSHSVGI